MYAVGGLDGDDLIAVRGPPGRGLRSVRARPARLRRGAGAGGAGRDARGAAGPGQGRAAGAGGRRRRPAARRAAEPRELGAVGRGHGGRGRHRGAADRRVRRHPVRGAAGADGAGDGRSCGSASSARRPRCANRWPSTATRVELLREPATRVVDLRGTGPSPEAMGRLIWHETAGGQLFVANLPPAPAGKAYEMWTLGGPAPRPAGVFQVDASGRDGCIACEPAGRPATTFAVTLEPEAGVPADGPDRPRLALAPRRRSVNADARHPRSVPGLASPWSRCG